jgi:hypothetical protein
VFVRARLLREGQGGQVEEGEKVSDFFDADRDVKMINVTSV